MRPVNGNKLSYLKAQPSILRSTGLSVEEVSKNLKKSERWVVKWSSRNDGFEDRKEWEDRKSLMRQLKEF